MMKKRTQLGWKLGIAGLATASLITSVACGRVLSKKLINSPGRVGSVSDRSLEGPGNESELIRSNYKAGEVAALCKSAIEEITRRLDAIAKLKPAERNTASTLLAFESTLSDVGDQVSPLSFMGYVSTDTQVRQEGSKCEEDFNSFNVGVFSRRDLYEAIKSSTPANAEEKRLLAKTLEAFETNGLNLPDEKLEQVKGLKQHLAALESQFTANLNNDLTSISLDKAELAGVPEDTISRLKRAEDGKYIVTTKVTDYTQVMQNATSSETRRKLLAAYFNRAAETNVKLLEDAIALRQKIATVMGYKNWAEYRIRGRMAQDSATVFKFLGSLKEKLAERNRSDLAALLKYKKELDPSATEVKAWDSIYLGYQLKKKNYSLDNEQIRQYFPAETVINGLFEVYSRLLGVKYTEVAGARTWAPEVKLYRITDAVDSRLIGYFYADFFPRNGKYEHAAAFPLISGRFLGDGKYSHPVASIVANFNPPANGKPSLLSHEEVETIFHEFGHIMHMTLTHAPYSSLSGSAVAQDFVEAPSQMLENWVWSPEVLKLISGHYKNAAEKLPEDVLKKMLEARDFNQGLFYTRQLFYALLDMSYHTSGEQVDTSQIFDRLHKEIVGYEPIAGGHFQASFGHLMGGYDAGYYGYLWSEVYAADMFTRFQATSPLDSKVGADYRRVILEKGNMLEGQDLLKEFLGRESTPDAFFKKLHIGN